MRASRWRRPWTALAPAVLLAVAACSGVPSSGSSSVAGSPSTGSPAPTAPGTPFPASPAPASAPATPSSGQPAAGQPAAGQPSPGTPSPGPSGAQPSRNTAARTGATVTAAGTTLKLDVTWLQLTMDGAGHSRGFGVRYDRVTDQPTIVYVAGTGSAWTASPTAYHESLGAVADDGVNTYALTLDADGGVHLLLRAVTGGAISRVDLGRHYEWYPPHSQWPGILSGSIVAKGGRWWAVWSGPPGEGDGGKGLDRLWTARTLGTPYAAHSTGLPAQWPSMVLTGDSVTVAYTENVSSNDPATTRPVTIAVPEGDGFRVVNRLGHGENPTLTNAGGVLRVTSIVGSSECTVQVDERGPSGWRRSVLARKLETTWGYNAFRMRDHVYLTAVGSTVVVGFSSYGDTISTTHGELARRTGNGAWSYSTLESGPRTANGPTALIYGLWNVGGRAMVLRGNGFTSPTGLGWALQTV